MNYLSLPIGEKSPELVNAVIEIPARGVNKYEYDKKLHVFKLDRPLYSPVHYPGDYGFVPRTLACDDDPLDILVLVDQQPTLTGCLVEVRPIGLLEMLDQGIKDEKVLAVSSNDPRYKHVRDYKDVEPHVLREIAHFFEIYKDLEGKRTKTIAWHDIKAAHVAIRDSHKRYVESVKAGENAA
jgi:inorganic pyrophosphatase